MTSPSPFAEHADYAALPRLAGLVLSPDGTRLVTTVTTPAAAGSGTATALWEVDPAGERPARRLTRSAAGESAPAFTPDGDLLFLSARPDPAAADPEPDGPAALWRLPAAGEAAVLGSRPGAIGGVAVARGAGTVVVTAMTLPGAATGEDDAARRAARKDAGVSGVLHAGHPVRFWDHDLGPDAPRLLVRVPGGWRDLTPDPGHALVEAGFDVAPDGATVVSTWAVPQRGGGTRRVLVALDTATGERRTLADDPDAEYSAPLVSPDGTRVACLRETLSTADAPPDVRLVVLPRAGGEPVDAAPGWDRWVTGACWTPDGALVVTADEEGRAPVFRIDDGRVTRLTGDHGAYSDLQVSPDGGHVLALRGAVDAPPAPVRLDAHAAEQHPVGLPGPAEPPPLPGTLTEVTTPPTTARRCAPGWCCPRGTRPRRCCCGSTAARSTAGTPGSGGGTRG